MEGGELFDRVTEKKRFNECDAADAAYQMLLASSTTAHTIAIAGTFFVWQPWCPFVCCPHGSVRFLSHRRKRQCWGCRAALHRGCGAVASACTQAARGRRAAPAVSRVERPVDGLTYCTVWCERSARETETTWPHAIGRKRLQRVWQRDTGDHAAVVAKQPCRWRTAPWLREANVA